LTRWGSEVRLFYRPDSPNKTARNNRFGLFRLAAWGLVKMCGTMKGFALYLVLLSVCILGAPCARAQENREAKADAGASTCAMSTSTSPDSAPHSPQKPPVVAQLETLVEGLEMPSETDAPFRVFWAEQTPIKKQGAETDEGDAKGDELQPADYARMAGLSLKGNEPVEMRSLSELLDTPATVEKWMSADDQKTARRFADLRAFLNANFAEIEVLAWGTNEKQIVVVGRVEGGFAGLVTLVVET